jgi:hypothetical protein
MKINVPVELKAIFRPLALLAVLIVLFLIVFKEGLARISAIRGDLEAAQKNEGILSQKESFLRNAQVEVTSFTDISLAAIPAKNPALIALSQLKIFASTKNVLLSNLKVGSENKDTDLSSIQILFDIDGDLVSVLDFLKSINSFLPLSLVEKVKLTSQAGAGRANITMKVFSSPFPKKLSSLTEPIPELSTEEKSILSEIMALTLPPFVEVEATGPTGRINPFEQ